MFKTNWEFVFHIKVIRSYSTWIKIYSLRYLALELNTVLWNCLALIRALINNVSTCNLTPALFRRMEGWTFSASCFFLSFFAYLYQKANSHRLVTFFSVCKPLPFPLVKINFRIGSWIWKQWRKESYFLFWIHHTSHLFSFHLKLKLWQI